MSESGDRDAKSRSHRAVRRLGAVSLGAAVVAIGVYLATVGTRAGQLMSELIIGGRPASREATAGAEIVLGVLTRSSIAIGIVAVIVIALVQGRPRLAVTAAGTIVAANLTSQLLKSTVLDRSDLLGGLFYALPNSFPSGHATAAASVAVGLLLVLPPLLRSPTVILAAVAVALVGASTLVLGWHRMADAIGGVFVATAWGAGLAALLAWRRGVEAVGRRTAEFGRITSTIPMVIGTVVALVGAAAYLLAVADPLGVLVYLAERQGSPALFVVGILITAGISLLSLGSLGFALRDCRLDARPAEAAPIPEAPDQTSPPR